MSPLAPSRKHLTRGRCDASAPCHSYSTEPVHSNKSILCHLRHAMLVSPLCGLKEGGWYSLPERVRILRPSNLAALRPKDAVTKSKNDAKHKSFLDMVVFSRQPSPSKGYCCSPGSYTRTTHEPKNAKRPGCSCRPWYVSTSCVSLGGEQLVEYGSRPRTTSWPSARFRGQSVTSDTI